jgi:hypothetical protein
MTMPSFLASPAAFLPGSRLLLALLLALVLPLAVGCDSNDDDGGGDGLGDLSVRATTQSSASALGVTVTYYRASSIDSASETISFSSGSGTLDLEDDVRGVQVTGIQAGQSFTYTLELLSDGEVVDSASGDFSTTVRVEAGDTGLPGS